MEYLDEMEATTQHNFNAPVVTTHTHTIAALEPVGYGLAPLKYIYVSLFFLYPRL